MKLIDLLKKRKSNIRQIKYLSLDGKSAIPDMVYVAKGIWLAQARKNEKAISIYVKKGVEIYSLSGELLKEGIGQEQYESIKYKGGILIFSADVSNDPSENKILNWFNQNYTTLAHRLMKKKIISQLVLKHDIPKSDLFKDGKIGAFSIASFFKGRYVDLKSGKIFNETSTSVAIFGVPSDVLQSIAEGICKEFEKRTLLIKDFNTDKFYLVDDK